MHAGTHAHTQIMKAEKSNSCATTFLLSMGVGIGFDQLLGLGFWKVGEFFELAQTCDRRPL